MKYKKITITLFVIIAIVFASWLTFGKKSVQNIPSRATLVINIIDKEGVLYEY